MPGYIFAHEGKQYDPDGTVQVPDVDTHNRQLEARELATWIQGPDRWHGYVEHPDIVGPWREAKDHSPANKSRIILAYPKVIVSTWLGTEIGRGRVTGLSRGFHGARIVHIRVKGTNGRTYIGKYGYDGGSFVRLRAATSGGI